MNFLSGLCALIVCCLFCFSLSLCQSMELPAEELNENQFNSPISSYRISLYLAIGAASSGKTFFKTPLTLSEDCIKTSRVIMQTFEKYTTMEATDEFLKSSIEEVLKHRNTSTFDNLVSMLCEELSKHAKQNSSIFPDFDERKKMVEIRRPAKNFILEVPSDQNLTIWAEKASLPLDDPEVAKLLILPNFIVVDISRFSNTTQEEIIGIFKAINNMYSDNRNNTAIIDNVFTKSVNDSIKNLVTQGIIIEKIDDLDPKLLEILRKVDQDFLRNELLKDKYSKIREEIGLNN